MSAAPDGLSRDDPQLNEILARYLQAVEAGESPDPEQLLREDPEYIEELRQFLADKRRVDAIAGAVNEDSGSPVEPVLNPLDVTTLLPENTAVDAPTLAPSPAAKAAPRPGAMLRYFGDYELLAEIARFGMGVAYKARQVKLNHVVAIKMILAGQLASQEDVQRFYTEAEAAAGPDHPGIVPIYEVGEHEGQHYSSMGFVDGEPLSARIPDRPLAPRDAVCNWSKTPVSRGLAVGFNGLYGFMFTLGIITAAMALIRETSWYSATRLTLMFAIAATYFVNIVLLMRLSRMPQLRN